jgi:hypothetical protein
MFPCKLVYWPPNSQSAPATTSAPSMLAEERRLEAVAQLEATSGGGTIM